MASISFLFPDSWFLNCFGMEVFSLIDVIDRANPKSAASWAVKKEKESSMDNAVTMSLLDFNIFEIYGFEYVFFLANKMLCDFERYRQVFHKGIIFKQSTAEVFVFHIGKYNTL